MPSDSTEEKTPRSRSQLRSMTGFAQTVVREDGFVLTLSLRSVNHRFLDVHLNLPDQLQRLEPAVRKRIQASEPRGHLQLRATLDREASRAPAVDEALIGSYIDLFRRVAAQHGLPLETALTTLAHLPGVIAGTGSSSLPASPRLEAEFLKALEDTLRDWDAMRREEGTVLEQDLRARGLRISSFVERMEQLRAEIVPVAQKKQRERLQAWVGTAGFDAARLAQEAAVLAEHTDITEEILRLKAHAAQFLGLLDGKTEIGKKLDFLLQEMQRELNTLTAKTTGLGECSLPMTEAALEIKGEVEKLREQAQNIQ